MAWTTPTNVVTGTPVSSTVHNLEVLENLRYLLSQRPVASVNRIATYSTTSTTFVDIDATNLIVTQTINSGRMLVRGTMILRCPNVVNEAAIATVILDSTTRAGDATYGLASQGQNGQERITFDALFTGLSVGSHNVKLQWRTLLGNGINNDIGFGLAQAHVILSAWEA